MPLEKGTTLAGYEITGILGQGGMGVVYEAVQVSLKRTVALKVLAPHLSDDVLFRERFRREGQLQAGIDHPNIVTVYEAGDSDHGVFIAMRLIRGPNLKDMIVSRELDTGRTVRILTPIAEALDAAHEAGLIHRDIKPQNILVAGRDHPFLADFGLTKAAGEKSLTRTGQFVGTFDYISPEQVKGEHASHKSDVYALAAVLYECLTGVVPFPKESEAAVLFAQMAEAPPKITDQRPELPSTLDQVIAKGMAKDPADRYESCGQLLLETNRTFTQRTRAAFTPPRPIEVPEEVGIRPPESHVPTRERTAEVEPPATGATEDPGGGAASDVAAAATGAGTAAAPSSVEPSASPATEADLAATAETAAEPTAAEAAAPTEIAAPPTEIGAAPTEIGAAPTEIGAAPTEARPTEVAPAGTDAKPAGTSEPGAPSRHAAPARTTRRRPASQRRVPVAKPPVERAERPTPSPARRLAWLGAAALVALVGGLLLGRATGGSEEAAPASTNVSAAGALELAYPSGWQRADDPPAIPGLRLRDQIAVAPRAGQNNALLAGATGATGPSLLPAEFRRRLDGLPARDDAVRLGSLDAYRYRDLEVEGLDRPLTLYVAPTTGGVATVACAAAPGAAGTFLPTCEEVAGGLELIRGEAFALGADEDYLERLDGTISRLNRSRARGTRSLRRADTARAQARAADSIAGAYGRASRALRGGSVSPAVAEAAASVNRALGQSGTAYERLAAAARREDGGAYAAARADARAGERAVQRALREVRAASRG